MGVSKERPKPDLYWFKKVFENSRLHQDESNLRVFNIFNIVHKISTRSQLLKGTTNTTVFMSLCIHGLTHGLLGWVWSSDSR